MKATFFIITTCIITFSCQGDEDINPNPKPSSLANLTLGVTRQLLPIQTLKNGQIAIFVNTSGEEMPFNLKYEEGIKELVFNDIGYQTEFISVDYKQNENGSGFSHSIRLHEQYNDYDSSDEVLVVDMVSTYDLGFVPFITLIDDSSDPVLGSFHSNINIANHNFNKVYMNLITPSQDELYNNLYYTVEQGVIGFEDETGELWALDRIE